MILDKLADSLAVKEVSRLLRKDPSAIVRYIRSRKLDAVRVGGTWRIPRASLEAFIANQTAAALPAAAPPPVRTVSREHCLAEVELAAAGL